MRLALLKLTAEARKTTQHGDQHRTPERSWDFLARASLPHPSSGGIRRGRRLSPVAGHGPDRGGLLRVPGLVLPEEERASVTR